MNKLIYIVITLVSGILLMIIHELPKNIAYYIIRCKEGKKKPKNLFYFWKNIDPVGIITTIAMYTPFSKQYKYTISNKKTSLTLGITGLTTLIITQISSIVVLKIFFKDYLLQQDIVTQGTNYYIYLVVLNFSILCMTMILVNLFPVTCFDMGLILLGSNSKHRGTVIVFDGILKLIFFFMVVLRVFLNSATIITNILISFFI